MPLLSVFLGLAVFMAILASPPKPGADAHRMTVLAPGGPGPGPVLTRRSGVPLGYMMPMQRRRVHLLDPRTALNLVAAHESRRRRRPPPYGGPRGPRKGGPRPPWKGRPKKKGYKSRDKPWMQATRGSSPAATRVRYHNGKPPRRGKGSKSKGPPRPPVPSYADGYAEDEELQDDVDELESERQRKRPSKSSKSSKSSKTTKPTYPKGWGPDGGYRVPAPVYPPYGPPYDTEEDEPGTGHLDLEERFINQHNQFYRHGYPSDGPESTPTGNQANKHGYYEDEEIEVADAGEDFPPDGLGSASNQKRRPAPVSYRRPSPATKYSTFGEDAADDSREDEVIHRNPNTKPKTRGRKKQSTDRSTDRDSRRQSMYHATFREEQQEHPLAAANFNYELSGSASETTSTSQYNNKNNNNHNNGNNHRPSYGSTDHETDAKPSENNFFRNRRPQYWG